MKVLAELKITILDGDEAGHTETSRNTCYTETEHRDFGVVEHLYVKWTHFHNYNFKEVLQHAENPIHD